MRGRPYEALKRGLARSKIGLHSTQSEKNKEKLGVCKYFNRFLKKLGNLD